VYPDTIDDITRGKGRFQSLLALTHNPLVSVIIPAFNAQRFIRQAVDSVLSQSYKNIELIVVDDGSTDQTASIVLEYCKSDSRISLLSQKTLGVAAARNLAIDKSRGEFIAPLDADDIWYREKIEAQVDAIVRSDNSVGVAYTWAFMIDEFGRVIGAVGSRYHGDVFLETIHDSVVGVASCPLMRKTSLVGVGLYDVDLRSKGVEGCEDWDLEIRLSRQYQFVCVPRYLVAYRDVPGSMSKNVRIMHKSAVAVLEKTRETYPELPGALFRWRRSAIDFNWSRRSLEQSVYLRGVALFLSAILRDPLRLLWLLTLPTRVHQRLDELLALLGRNRLPQLGKTDEGMLAERHQQSLDKPHLFNRLNYRRFAKIKSRMTQALTSSHLLRS
jgi:glycosyltransferase involved in cell wall biosynthesis